MMLGLLVSPLALGAEPTEVAAIPPGYAMAPATSTTIPFWADVDVPCTVGVGVAAKAEAASSYTVSGCEGAERTVLSFVRSARWVAAPTDRWLVYALKMTPVPVDAAAPATAAANPPPAPESPPVAALPLVHWTEVQVKKRVVPPGIPIPEGAEEVTCTVRVTLDAQGAATAVEARQCAGEVFPAVEAAMVQSSFYPVKVDGAPTAVQFDFRFVFRR